MNLTLARLALSLIFILGAGALKAADVTSPETNSPPAPDGWLQSSSRDLVLDVRHKWFEFGARQDACEFLATLVNFLVQANYTVHLSDDFIGQEINYYREFQKQEVPVELSKGPRASSHFRRPGLGLFQGRLQPRYSKLHQAAPPALDGASTKSECNHAGPAQ